MKKTFLVFTLLVGLSSLFAQGRFDGQSYIFANGGYVLERDSLSSGFMVKAGYGRVMGDMGWFGKAEAFYHDYEVKYIDGQNLPYQKYGLSVLGGYSLEQLAPIYFNFNAGGYLAYENANKGKDTDPLYNAKIPVNVKGVTYGIVGGAEIEYMFVDGLSFTIDYTQYYDLRSKFSKSNFGLFGGLKYYFN